jgi:Transposase
VVQLAGRAVDDVRRAEWNTAGKSKTGHGRWVKSIRWSLLKAPARQSVAQLAALHEVSHANKRLYRAFLLKEELRLLYTSTTDQRPPNTCAPGWPGRHAVSSGRSSSWPARSAATDDGILAAIRLGLSKSVSGSTTRRTGRPVVAQVIGL